MVRPLQHLLQALLGWRDDGKAVGKAPCAEVLVDLVEGAGAREGRGHGRLAGAGLRLPFRQCRGEGTAKLTTGQESTDYKSYVRDTGQSGIIVTARARKNRLAKPMVIKFEINHTEGTNSFKGLEEFCTPENFDLIGIAMMKKEEDKKNKKVTFVPGGTKYYVRHLDKYLSEKQLSNPEVFTKEVLIALKPIILKYFSYSSYEEQKEIAKKLDAEYAKYETNGTLDIDDESTDKELFS